MTRKRRPKQNYLDKNLFLDEMLASKKSGVPTDGYARGCLEIADHMLTSHQFSGYSRELKEDMLGHAMLCAMKAIKTFNPDKTNNAFGYCTRTCWTAFLQILNKHYRYVNLKRELLADVMAEYDKEFSRNTLGMFQDCTWEEGDDD